MKFDENCTKCRRLNQFLIKTKEDFPDYYCKPVAPFGDSNGHLLIVGLAPGLHGANKTGRPFTGDYAGILLYETLYEFGFSSAPQSINNDQLELRDCKITNAVKCLPPANKPLPEEVKNCNKFLACEINTLPKNSLILALGTIAHNAVLEALELKKSNYKFAHGSRHKLINGLILYDSYHCSRYNTQTKRLTKDMFQNIFKLIVQERGENKCHISM
ncbi:MAG: uracil-DNA glycosylase [Methylophilaceae bacterium]|nr:uracil-DNA glycosylase [Methylophilaceae bacterium]MBL6726225.1 uracil-DNA glycosylase [Methylophilaceae bacterium]MBL6728262.1 uracil-DNA glycosylase [Methylophilaceae bacterium]MBL6790862.1 uracil-DNA glycosylase [Methylophilaceae bacterium]